MPQSQAQKNEPEEESREGDLRAQEYAKEHLKFLKDNNPDLLAALEKSGDLQAYLSTTGEDAADSFRTMMAQTLRASQNLPYQKQMTMLQNGQESAEEIIRHEMIYQPLPEEATRPYLDAPEPGEAEPED